MTSNAFLLVGPRLTSARLSFKIRGMFKNLKPTPADYLIFTGLVVNVIVIALILYYYLTS